MLEKYGNMMKCKTDAFCITTNGFVTRNGECVMGRGIALTVKEKNPKVSRMLGNLIKKNGNVVNLIANNTGKTALIAFPVKPVTVINNGNNLVMHAASKYKLGDTVPGFLSKADMKIVEKSCIELVELANGHKEWKTIALPRPGCGAGELYYSKVKPVLEKYLDDRFYIYTFKKDL